MDVSIVAQASHRREARGADELFQTERVAHVSAVMKAYFLLSESSLGLQ